MIPISLTFEAFGPFPQQETIDFSHFQADRLFLISGQTGSGKTTIFDAIAFALFGEASGSMRQADSFKSDFANEATVCYVEFAFFVKGKQYVVHREPIQMRLKRNGNITKENATATLTLEDNTILSGASTVDKYITVLLGITAEQFKKIVMLPQGEFRRFLSDDSTEKQKILRKIFGTKILDDFTEQLRIDSNESKIHLERLLTEYQTLFHTIEWLNQDETKEKANAGQMDIPFVLSLLHDLNDESEKNIQTLVTELEELQQKKEALNLPYFLELNKRFEQLEQTKEKLAQLESHLPQMEQYKKQAQLIALVKEQIPLFHSAKKETQQLSFLTQRQESYTKDLSEQETQQKKLTQTYHSLKTEQAQIPQLIQKIEQLKQTLSKYQEYVELQKSCTILEEKQTKLESHKASQQSGLAYSKLLEQQKSMQKELKELGELLSTLHAHLKLTEQYHIIKEDYEKTFHLFINGQASLLAIELKENCPCPVCGALDHPNPAVNQQEHISQEQLNASKLRYDSIVQQVEVSYANCSSKLSGFGFAQEQYQSTEAIIFLNDKQQELETAISEIEQQLSTFLLSPKLIDRLQTQAPSDIEKKLAETETNIALAKQELDQCKQNLAPLAVQFVSLQASEQLFISEISEIESKVDTIQHNFTLCQAKLQETNAQYERTKEALSQTLSQIEQLKGSLAESKSKCSNFLATQQLTKEQFNEITAQQSSFDELQLKISNYEKECSVQTAFLSSLKEELQGKSSVNITTLQESAAVFERLITERKQSHLTLSATQQSNQRVEQKIKICSQSYKKQSEQYAKQNKLFEVANGKYSDRINFERFVLASYFDQVIENANIRLNQMTASRYTLMRRTEREKGNKSSGLSLAVFDTYTGKARHVNTVSGGESFKFALALALGLADIISQNAGGIELNTLFIDEGFGSLDSNALDLAIACLEQLRNSGRYIGIISHVNELKEKISSKIIVTQHPTGSHISLK